MLFAKTSAAAPAETPSIPRAVQKLIATLNDSSLERQCDACQSLSRLGADAASALPALTALIESPRPSTIGYYYPHKSALQAAVSIGEALGSRPGSEQVQALLLKTIRADECNLAKAAALGLETLAKRGTLSVDTVKRISSELSIRDHTGVPDQAILLSALLHADERIGVRHLVSLIEASSVSRRVDTIKRPEERKLGKDGDFILDITIPAPAGLILVGGRHELLIVGQNAIATSSGDIHFDKQLPSAPSLYRRLVDKI